MSLFAGVALFESARLVDEAFEDALHGALLERRTASTRIGPELAQFASELDSWK